MNQQCKKLFLSSNRNIYQSFLWSTVILVILCYFWCVGVQTFSIYIILRSVKGYAITAKKRYLLHTNKSSFLLRLSLFSLIIIGFLSFQLQYFTLNVHQNKSLTIYKSSLKLSWIFCLFLNQFLETHRYSDTL